LFDRHRTPLVSLARCRYRDSTGWFDVLLGCLLGICSWVRYASSSRSCKHSRTVDQEFKSAMNSLDPDNQETSTSLVPPASAYSQIMQSRGDYGPTRKKKKKSHSKGCMLTDVHGSDHRRTSTEAFRQQIDGLGEEAKQLPVRVSVHILALVLAGRGPPERSPPRHPTSNKQAFWVASHLCHNKSCTQPDHLVWEPNWANRQRDGCLGGSCCVHLPYKCIRAHRRPVDNVDWSRL